MSHLNDYVVIIETDLGEKKRLTVTNRPSGESAIAEVERQQKLFTPTGVPYMTQGKVLKFEKAGAPDLVRPKAMQNAVKDIK